MSYYFTIIGTRDNPMFELEFGTSKAGGDGIARFREEARHMNQFIVHSSLDIVEEVQWGNNGLYLKNIDRFQNNFVHCYLTGGNVKFLLLMNPDPTSTTYANFPGANQAKPQSTVSRQSTLLANNPSSAATEEAVKQFMLEVFEAWVKCIMNPFYQLNQAVSSPVFRQRVATAAKRYL